MLIWEAKEFSKSFRSCGFHFTHRSGNQMTYAVDQDDMLNGVDCYWVEDAPEVVYKVTVDYRRWLDPPYVPIGLLLVKGDYWILFPQVFF